MRIALAMLLSVALTACGRGASTAGEASVPPVADDDTPANALPTPAATPGTAVTGMPTQPPPPATTEAVVEPAPADVPADATATAPVDGASAPNALPAPVDEDTAADAATTTAPSPSNASTTVPAPAPAGVPAITTADASAAASVVNQYMAALGANAPARAQGLWATTPNDSAVLQLARGATFNVGVGAPAADANGRITVPVDVRGKADDGSDRHVQAAYTLQRTPTGTWRIYSAVVRDAAP